MAQHPASGQVRHRYLGLDAHPRTQRPLPTLGHGPGSLQAGLQNLAGLPAQQLGARILISSRWMDSPGFKSAAAEELPDARAVMDPFSRRAPGWQRLG